MLSWMAASKLNSYINHGIMIGHFSSLVLKWPIICWCRHLIFASSFAEYNFHTSYLYCVIHQIPSIYILYFIILGSALLTHSSSECTHEDQCQECQTFQIPACRRPMSCSSRPPSCLRWVWVWVVGWVHQWVGWERGRPHHMPHPSSLRPSCTAVGSHQMLCQEDRHAPE